MSLVAKQNQIIREINLGPPKGPIARKYSYFASEMDFQLSYFIGPYGTAKTNAGIDYCLIHCISYPGAHVGICRSTLKSLKDTTLKTLKARAGKLIHSINENEGIYRITLEQVHPVTKEKVYSYISGFGIDKTDDEDWMGSLELSGLFIDEADGTNRARRQKLAGRTRLRVFHKELKVSDYAEYIAPVWGITPEQAFNILHNCPNTNFNGLDADHPMPSMNQVKMVFNPKGPSDIWKDAFKDVPFPQGGPDANWANENAGIVEVHVPPERHQGKKKFKFGAGDLIVKDSKRYFVKTQVDKIVKTISSQDSLGNSYVDEEEFHVDDVGLIQQQNVIYAFGHENDSLDKNNIRFGFFLDDDIQDKYFYGVADDENMYVFPNFIEDYVENGGHIVRSQPHENIMSVANGGIGGLDDGISHPAAAVLAFTTRRSNSLVFFAEYCVSGRYADENGVNIMQKIPIGQRGRLNMVWGYDPSIDRRTTNATQTPLDLYRQSLNNMMPADKGDEAFKFVNELLQPKMNISQGQIPYGMLVSEDCPQLIETMKSITWEMIHKQRNNHLVDIADALKYACSIHHRVGSRPKRKPAKPSRVGAGSYR